MAQFQVSASFEFFVFALQAAFMRIPRRFYVPVPDTCVVHNEKRSFISRLFSGGLELL
jgi:hypothetical protein